MPQQPCKYYSKRQLCPSGPSCRYLHTQECRDMYDVLGDALWADDDNGVPTADDARRYASRRTAGGTFTNRAMPVAPHDENGGRHMAMRVATRSTAAPAPVLPHHQWASLRSAGEAESRRPNAAVQGRLERAAARHPAAQQQQRLQRYAAHLAAHERHADPAAFLFTMTSGVHRGFHAWDRDEHYGGEDRRERRVEHYNPMHRHQLPARGMGTSSRGNTGQRRHHSAATAPDDDIDVDNMSYEELVALCEASGDVEVPMWNWQRWILSDTQHAEALAAQQKQRRQQGLTPSSGDGTDTTCSICLDDCFPLEDTPSEPPTAAGASRGPSNARMCPRLLTDDEEDGDDDDGVTFIGRRSAPLRQPAQQYTPAVRAVEVQPAAARVVRLPCQHCFHADCVAPYFATKHLCPVCRYDLNARHVH